MKVNIEGKTRNAIQVFLAGLGIVGGLWLVAAPFALNYAGTTTLDAKTKKVVPVDLTGVTLSDIICGLLLVGLIALVVLGANIPALQSIKKYATIGVILVGVYLMAAPYIFDILKVASYLALDKPNTNDVMTGLITVIAGGFAYQNEYLPVTNGKNLPTPVINQV